MNAPCRIIPFPAPIKPTQVFVDRLDGTPWIERGFMPGDANAPWKWIVASVAKELQIAVEAVSYLDDMVTVNGLPCYAVRIEPRIVWVNGRRGVIVDEWEDVANRESGCDYRLDGDDKVHWIRGNDPRLGLRTPRVLD